MENNAISRKLIVAIIVLLLAILLSAGLSHCKRYDDRMNIKESVESQITHDTVFVREPISVSDTIIRYVSIPIPKRDVRYDTVEVVETDTIRIIGDTIRLPITQKVYRDSNYTAYVSGYQPSLDSISVVNHTITKTVTITEIKRRSMWSVGINAGYGFGIQSKRFEPYIGIGVTYNISR